MGLHITSYFISLPQLRKQYEELGLDAYYFKNFYTLLTTGNNFGDIPFWNHPTRMKNLVHSIESAGLSQLLITNSFPEQSKVIEKTGNPARMYPAKTTAEVLFRANDHALPSKSIRFRTVPAIETKPSYFVLASRSHKLILPALPVPHQPADFLKTHSYYSHTYEYTIYRNKLPAGEYSLWVMSEKTPGAKNWEAQPTGKYIQLY